MPLTQRQSSQLKARQPSHTHTPTHGLMSSDTWLATRMGDLDEVIRLRVGQQGGEHIDTCDNHGYTTLHRASDQGHLDLTAYCIEHNASLDLATIEFKHTPLHLVAMGGHTHVAEHLVRHGADLTLVEVHGNTALQLAEQFGNGAAIKAAIEQGLQERSQEQGLQGAVSGLIDVASAKVLIPSCWFH